MYAQKGCIIGTGGKNRLVSLLRLLARDLPIVLASTLQRWFRICMEGANETRLEVWRLHTMFCTNNYYLSSRIAEDQCIRRLTLLGGDEIR